MKIEQLVLDEVKKQVSDFTVNYTAKQVTHKVGFEEVFWLTWKEQDLEHIFAQHLYQPKIRTPKEIANEIFFTPFKSAFKNSAKYKKLVAPKHTRKRNRKIRTKLLEKILEEIPVCRERITKCGCRDHEVNADVFDYLEELLRITKS